MIRSCLYAGRESFVESAVFRLFKLSYLGFAGVILLGALLLMLPISTTAGDVTPFQ